MTLRDELMINQAAQGVFAVPEARAWFAAKSIDEQHRLLHALSYMVAQAHPTPPEIDEAIPSSGLKPGHTACVLIRKDLFKVQAPKILGLPEHELPRVFNLLLALLRVADHRRRSTTCASGCSHWWHRDLSDPNVVESILGRRM